MKKEYCEPEVEIIRLCDEDVITTSIGEGEGRL